MQRGGPLNFGLLVKHTACAVETTGQVAAKAKDDVGPHALLAWGRDRACWSDPA